MLIYHRVLNVKVKPEECPCRGLFCDCEIFGNLCMTSVSSSGLYDCMMYEKIQSAPNSPHCRARRGCIKQGSGHNGLVTGGLSWSWSAAGSWSVSLSLASLSLSSSLSPQVSMVAMSPRAALAVLVIAAVISDLGLTQASTLRRWDVV